MTPGPEPKHSDSFDLGQHDRTDIRSIHSNIDVPAAIDHVDDGMKPDEYPEGGRQAWLVVLSSTFISFSSFGLINSFGVFQHFYRFDYLSQSSESAVSLIGSLQVALLYVSGLVAGTVFDVSGVRYLYPIAGLGTTVSLVLLSFSQPQHYYQQLLTHGVMVGVFVGCGYNPAMSILAQYFYRRRAMAMGIVAGGSSIGGVIIPIMITRLIPRVGFGWTMRVMALIILVCFSCAYMLAKLRVAPKERVPLSKMIDFTGFRDRSYVAYALGALCINAAFLLPYYHASAVSALLGVDAAITTNLLSIINGAAFFGRVLSGVIGDQVGSANVLCVAMVLSSLLCLCLWLTTTNAAGTIAFAVMFGCFSGAFVSIMPVCVAKISPPESMGARLGTFLGVAAIGAVAGPPIAGTLLSPPTIDGYHHMIIFAGVMLLVGALFLMLGRFWCCRKILAKW
ncbi:hypothetical protein RI367_004117 [Sorochytrium milnesiophthora]